MSILSSIKRKSSNNVNSAKKGLKSKKLFSIIKNNNLRTNTRTRIFYNIANLSKIIVPNKLLDAHEFETIIINLQTIEEEMQKINNNLFRINASKIVCAYEDNDTNKSIIGYSIPENQNSLDEVRDGYKYYINLGVTQKNYIVPISDLAFLENFYKRYSHSSFSNFDFIISLLLFIVSLNNYTISMKNIVYSDVIFTDDEKYITLNNIHNLVEGKQSKFDYLDNLKWFLNYLAIFFDLLHPNDKYYMNLDKNYYNLIAKCKNFHYFSSKFINLYDKIFNKGEIIDTSSFVEIIINELNNLSIDGDCVYNRERFSNAPNSDDNCYYLTEGGYNEIFSEGTVVYSTYLYDVIKVVDTVYIIYKNFDQEAKENINLLIGKFIGKNYSSENVYNLFSIVYHDDYNHPIGFALKNADPFIGGGRFTAFTDYINTKGKSNIINVLEEIYYKIYHYYNNDSIIFKKEIEFDNILFNISNINIIFLSLEHI